MVDMGKPFLLSAFLIDVIHDLLLVVKGLLSQRNATCEIRCCEAQQFRSCATPRTPPPLILQQSSLRISLDFPR